jgi:SAM-dependent methyltransferase
MSNFLNKLWNNLPPPRQYQNEKFDGTIEWPVKIQCPSCKGSLSWELSAVNCMACGKRYNITERIIRFIENPGHWPDIPQEDLDTLIRSAKESGWRPALQNLDTKLPAWFRRIADESRADFSFLSTLTNDKIALDLGTGWGPVAIGLARQCAAVIGVDPFYPRLEFIDLRCTQDHVRNIFLMQANALELPFERDQFDLVSLIGVFEWVGANSPLSEDPDISQDQCLKECHRVLKSKGQLIIGIENRIGMKYLMGQPDDHTSITNITFLPRSEANLRSRELQNQDFKIRTHTLPDYVKLLDAAGFSDIQFFAAFPSYQFWQAIVPLKDYGPIHFFLNHLQLDEPEGSENQKMIQVLKTLSLHGHAQKYVNAFFILAQKRESH